MHGRLATAAVRMQPAASASARARVALTYLWRHHRWPRLDAPLRFTEFVQVRKLHDRTPAQHMLLDKLAAKELVGCMLGLQWITPTLWSGPALPDVRTFPVPAMLKARHGCMQNTAICKEPSADHWRQMQKASACWLRGPYGSWLDEWAYRDIPLGLLAEPLLGNGQDLPIDYKVYVFGGSATHVQVHLGRGKTHRWILHDRNWRPLLQMIDGPLPPRSLAAMLDAAETLSGGRDFLRVDFYEIDGKPRFGEFCLYPGSGLDPFAADWIDFELGALWHEAAAGEALTHTDFADLGLAPGPDHTVIRTAETV